MGSRIFVGLDSCFNSVGDIFWKFRGTYEFDKYIVFWNTIILFSMLDTHSGKKMVKMVS